jgi:ABC-2 type transport system ATP-binding protein
MQAQRKRTYDFGASMKDRLQRGTAISVRGLIKRYPDGTLANNGIDLDVYEGEVLSILGPNGAGKTTLVRQITAELKPTSGSIKIKDVDPLLEPLKAKQLMGVIPQEGSLFSHLTVQEHLYFFGRLKGLTKSIAQAQAERLIPLLSLKECRGKKIKTLSGGTQRRVFIALALLGDPPILVLDEPTAGLDPAARRDVWDLVSEVKKWCRTVILTTHYLEEAELLSDRIGILQSGELKRLGTLEDLYRSVPKTYRLVYNGAGESAERASSERVVYDAADFEGVQKIIEERRLTEYSVRRISLEDVYLELIGAERKKNET